MIMLFFTAAKLCYTLRIINNNIIKYKQIRFVLPTLKRKKIFFYSNMYVCKIYDSPEENNIYKIVTGDSVSHRDKSRD